MPDTDQMYWHGGSAGLTPGQFIIPRNALPLTSLEHQLSSISDPAEPGRVYVTSRKQVAHAFAVRFANSPAPGARVGAVYQVRPIGAVAPDPDFPPAARCWSAARAEILHVVTPQVRDAVRVATRIMGAYTLWSDGSPVYDHRGYMLPAPEWRECGVTPADLLRFGRWLSHGEIAYFPADDEVRWVDL